MTWFHIKKKRIVLDCYVDRESVAKLAPLQKTSSTIPSWWKSLPKRSETDNLNSLDGATLKSCLGFTNLYNRGFVIPMWSDLSVRVGQDGPDNFNYHYADLVSAAQ
jgi:hypothetical protein